MAREELEQLKPNLRFPKFRDSSSWDARTLNDYCERLTATVGANKLTPVSITAGKGFVAQAEKFGRDISGAQYSQYIHLRRGDFAYNRGNSKRFPQGSVYELTEFSEAAASNAFYCFRLHDDCEPGFFTGLFERNAHGLQLARDITSGARSTGLLNISAGAFFGITIPMPEAHAEQKMIADCLRSLDDLIAAERRKFEALRARRQGLMQQLFPQAGDSLPRLRFREFRSAREWKEEKLDDLATPGTGHTPSKAIAENYNGGIKWVSLADSKRLDRGVISETSIEISEEGIKNSSAVMHPAGSVVLSRDAGVGKGAVLGGPMAVSQHFIVWTCKPSRLSNWFLYYQLQSLKPVFERIATGNTIKTIGLPYFKSMRIAVPQLREQHRIAECLSSLDALLDLQGQKLDALGMHKRGLLQQLFPVVKGNER